MKPTDPSFPPQTAGNPFRNENEAAHARVAELEDRLRARDETIAKLEAKLGDQEAVFRRLEGTLDAGKKRTRAPLALGLVLSGVGAAALAIGVLRAGHAPPPAAPSAEVAPITTVNAAPLADPCARMGVHLTVDGRDGVAVADDPTDRAGHHYRRGGERSPWFTVNGPLYVHGVGGFLPKDEGTTQLSLLTIKTKGEPSAYTLARGGRSLLTITSRDDQRIIGHFEADVSKVEDPTREPPFGTPVVRARGTFCLAAHPADPNDTGP